MIDNLVKIDLHLQSKIKKRFQTMLIINVKEEESIDRALKRYKRKYFAVRMMKQLRNRKTFKKPSVKRRDEILNAEYRLKKYGS